MSLADPHKERGTSQLEGVSWNLYNSVSLDLMNAMLEDSFEISEFQTTEVTLSYVEGPDNGTCLLLIHGIGSRWQPFRPILHRLCERHHVYAVDLRGHGQSSHAPGAYTLQDYTRDVSALVVERIGVSVVIYGHSLGALVGINLAAQQPRWVRGLILGDPPLYHHDTATSDTEWQSAFEDLLGFMRAHPSPLEMNDWLEANMPSMTEERRRERVESLRTLDEDAITPVITNSLMEGISLSSLVPKVTCPVFLLRGDPTLGSALRDQDVAFALSAFAHASVINMDGVGHGILPVSQQPQLEEFIDSLDDI